MKPLAVKRRLEWGLYMKTEQVFVVQKFENGEWKNYDEFSTESAAKEHHYCLRLYGKPDDIFRVIYRETTICETDIDV